MRAGPTDRRLEPAGLGLRWGGSLLDDLVLPAHRWWSRRPRAPHRTVRRARGPERPAHPRATERLPTGVAADRAAGGRGDGLDARERDRTGGGAGPDAATRQAGLRRRAGRGRRTESTNSSISSALPGAYPYSDIEAAPRLARQSLAQGRVERSVPGLMHPP